MHAYERIEQHTKIQRANFWKYCAKVRKRWKERHPQKSDRNNFCLLVWCSCVASTAGCYRIYNLNLRYSLALSVLLFAASLIVSCSLALPFSYTSWFSLFSFSENFIIFLVLSVHWMCLYERLYVSLYSVIVKRCARAYTFSYVFVVDILLGCIIMFLSFCSNSRPLCPFRRPGSCTAAEFSFVSFVNFFSSSKLMFEMEMWMEKFR